MDLKTDFKLTKNDKIIGGAMAAFGVGLVGFGLLMLYRALPYLIKLAEQTIYLVIMLVVLALVGIVVFDPDTWRNLYYGWKNVSRSIRRAIIREDPIGVFDTLIARWTAKLVDLDDSLKLAVASRKRQENAIADLEGKATAADQKAYQARQRGLERDFERNAVQADRYRASADKLRPMAEGHAEMHAKLTEARDMVNSKLLDLNDQRDIAKIELDAMKASQATVKSFKRFFGDNPELAMYKLTIEEIERQTTEAEAEIDEFLRVIKPQLADQQLAKDAATANAVQKFNKYLTEAPATPKLVVSTPEQTPVSK